MRELDEEDRDEMDHSSAEGDGYGIAAAKIVAVQAPESARTAGRKPRALIGKSRRRPAAAPRGDSRSPVALLPLAKRQKVCSSTVRLQIYHTYPATPSEGNHIDTPFLPPLSFFELDTFGLASASMFLYLWVADPSKQTKVGMFLFVCSDAQLAKT